VQTAYANGGSTAYLREGLGLPVALTPTGVKHLHRAAQAFDVGVYWEANGHGTVLLGPAAQAAAERAGRAPWARDVSALLRMVNQAVGDALSGVLLAECLLRRLGWTFADWAALYAELPSRQAVLRVRDRGVIATADAETRCVAPEGLQAAVDAAVARHACGRAFVRPSGTEDVVRVYAEAATREACDALTLEVLRAVHRLAGGLGDAPEGL